MFFLLAALFSHMSLEEKVGQLLFVHFEGTEVTEEARELVRDIGVGGIIYYAWANGLNDKEEVKRLSEELQSSSKTPLFIAVDQEGDSLNRLSGGFSSFPGNRKIAERGDLEKAKEIAHQIGAELLSVGINLNFAPVVDLLQDPGQKMMANRSFGADPAVVLLFAKAMIDGYHAGGVLTTIKHFPGHGATSQDSHDALPVSQETERQLIPFRALSRSSDFVMTAHLIAPEIDPLLPASISPKAHALLRSECHFDGIVITDSLVMEGLLSHTHSLKEAALLALDAGADMLLLGGKLLTGKFAGREVKVDEIREIRDEILSAIHAGRLSEERINASLERILTIKNRHL